MRMERGKVMSLSLPGSERPWTKACSTGGLTTRGHHAAYITKGPRNRRGSSQVHITRRRFNMTFPPSPKRRAKEGASERRTNDCRCGTHEFKAFQNDFFLSPSSAPAPVPPSLSLVHACALGIRQEVAARWFCPRE